MINPYRACASYRYAGGLKFGFTMWFEYLKHNASGKAVPSYPKLTLYSKLERDSQKKLLREMVNLVVVCPDGTILRMELLPPFAYLRKVRDRVRQGSEDVEKKQRPAPSLVNVRV